MINDFGVIYHDFSIKGYTVATRSVFVIAPDGTVGYVWAAENPGIQPDYAEVISYCLKN